MTQERLRTTGRPSAAVWVLCAGVLLLGGGPAVINLFYHQRVLDRIERLERRMKEEARVLSTTWISGGLERTWTTKQLPGEALTDMAARHKTELQILQDIWPPDAK